MEIAGPTDSASASRRLIQWRPTGIISDGSCDMSSSVVMVSGQRYRECPTLVGSAHRRVIDILPPRPWWPANAKLSDPHSSRARDFDGNRE